MNWKIRIIIIYGEPSISAFQAATTNDGKNLGIARDSIDAPKAPAAAVTKQSAPAIETQTSSAECSSSAENNACANPSITSQPSVSGGIRPVDQLLYLAKLLKFEVIDK